MNTPVPADVFLFEAFWFDRRAGALFRRDAGGGLVPVAMGSRALAVLDTLVAREGHLVPKDEIMHAVWPETVVEDNNLTVQISALRRVLDQGRAGGSCIQTIARRGYRFLGRLARDGGDPRPRLSIVVLPFANLSNDPEQEYFVDGMVEEITTAIARLPWLFVIARNSSFTYKGKAVDVRQVGNALGVRYVLEGSVRKGRNRVRINAQLIDTTTGAHIWADRFDGALDNIFDLQDQVASNVAGAIEPKLRQSEIERARRKPTANLTAYDLYLRALAQTYRFTDEGHAEAVVLARQALAIDPSYAPAAALVGRCRAHQRVQWWGALSAADVAEACRLARQALEAERDDAETISQAAYTLFYLAGEAAIAAAALDRVLAFNPNAAHAWMVRGNIHALRNQPEAAIEAFERARRLSPFDPYAFAYACGTAIAHLAARRFEQATQWADRALHGQPRMVAAMRVKVAANAYLGRLDEARAELSRMLAINPEQTIAGYREDFHFAAPEVLELYVTGLRLAGLPEE
jgi:TolB-like protein